MHLTKPLAYAILCSAAAVCAFATFAQPPKPGVKGYEVEWV